MMVFIVTICKVIHVIIIKNANDKYVTKIAIEQNKILEEQERAELEKQIREEQENKERKKFLPLNEEEITKVDRIYRRGETKNIYLTFDDGPTTQVTPYILDLLKQENIKATFFILGYRAEINPLLVKREYEEGHFIANHGYSHKYSQIYEKVDNVIEEYNRTNQIIRNAIENQNYNSLVFRFPGGSIGGYYNNLKSEAKQALRNQGIASLDWNALTKDAEGAKTREQLLQNFYETTQNKSNIVILMHDAADKILTYEVLPEIISWARENGYAFKTLYDVIGREII